jgi:hypothetical protein
MKNTRCEVKARIQEGRIVLPVSNLLVAYKKLMNQRET